MNINLNMLWPIAVIVISNTFYHICAKSAPAEMSPFASLTITYVIAAAASALMYFVFNRGESLIQEYRHLNWASIVLGIVVIGLEVGNIYMYKVGWEISVGQVVQSVILAVVLIGVGCLFFNESITLTKVIGIAVCTLGLWLINK